MIRVIFQVNMFPVDFSLKCFRHADFFISIGPTSPLLYIYMNVCNLRVAVFDFSIVSIHQFIFSGKTKQGKNGISGFVQNILSSKKKASNLKRGSNLPTMRIQVLELIRFQTFVTALIKWIHMKVMAFSSVVRQPKFWLDIFESVQTNPC